MEKTKRLARELVQAQDEKKLHAMRAQIAQAREQKLLEELIDALAEGGPGLRDRGWAESLTRRISSVDAPQGQ